MLDFTLTLPEKYFCVVVLCGGPDCKESPKITCVRRVKAVEMKDAVAKTTEELVARTSSKLGVVYALSEASDTTKEVVDVLIMRSPTNSAHKKKACAVLVALGEDLLKITELVEKYKTQPPPQWSWWAPKIE